VRDHVRDAEGDDARLARTCAREDQHRTPEGLGGEALLRVERGQIQHRARSLICMEMNASAQGEFLRCGSFLKILAALIWIKNKK